jgi:(p)ppGpp synthase/HD superfamily hydrolase
MAIESDVPKLTARFEEALQYAARLHAKQLRKGSNIPYVSHLLAVTAIVLEDGGSEDEAIAALLHDAIEDQGGDPTRQEICRRFGEKVVAMVNGCTDAEVIPKPPWLERKKKHLEHLRKAPSEVIRISAADKLHNARAVLSDFRQHGHTIWARFKGGKEGSLWHYRRLVEVFREAGPSVIVEELGRVVAELERLAGATC